MLVTFDTETTGLPNFKAPHDHPSQPDIVQLAAVMHDENRREVGCINLIINTGKSIPDEAANVHGITSEMAARYGCPSVEALKMFDRFISKAKEIVAHNISFDLKLLKTAYARAGMMHAYQKLQVMPQTCTMQLSTPIVNLPPTPKMRAAGFNNPKAPRLEECVKHFFNEDLEGAHDALIDVRACARVYYHLKDMLRQAA
jgi:DNA polymerase-3 subunit epsilon